MRIRNILIIPPVIFLIAILAWLIVIPGSLIQESIEQAASRPGSNVTLSIDGMNKGILFSLSAERMTLSMQNSPALYVERVSATPSAASLKRGNLIYRLDGSVSGGTIAGEISARGDGFLKIRDAGLSGIPAIRRFGMGIDGTLSADIRFDRNRATIRFQVPDLVIGDEALAVIPFITSFRSIQGAAVVSANTIRLESVSLEGTKGHARLKGSISNGVMDLALEVMPDMDRLTPLESMMIGKYIVSPGYYVIPIHAPLP
jgi:type II secretion system protein N